MYKIILSATLVSFLLSTGTLSAKEPVKKIKFIKLEKKYMTLSEINSFYVNYAFLKNKKDIYKFLKGIFHFHLLEKGSKQGLLIGFMSGLIKDDYESFKMIINQNSLSLDEAKALSVSIYLSDINNSETLYEAVKQSLNDKENSFIEDLRKNIPSKDISLLSFKNDFNINISIGSYFHKKNYKIIRHLLNELYPSKSDYLYHKKLLFSIILLSSNFVEVEQEVKRLSLSKKHVNIKDDLLYIKDKSSYLNKIDNQIILVSTITSLVSYK